MLPDAHVVHQMLGRLRVRIPSRRRNAQYFARVRQQLAELEGVRAIETNHMTGSVLILHQLSAREIEEHAVKHGLFRLRFSLPDPAPLSQRISTQLGKFGAGVERASGGAVDVPAVVAITFAAAASFQLLKNRVWPPGVTLLWYAVQRAVEWKEGAPADGCSPGGTWEPRTVVRSVNGL